LKRDIVTYLWDNFVQLSKVERIILIGHGPGCQPVMDLIEHRFASARKMVKLVIQIVGTSKIPVAPRYSDNDIRVWYKEHSWVVIPKIHPILGPEIKAKDLRRHGNLVPIDEVQPVRVFLKALPGIQNTVKKHLEKPDDDPLAV